jgi:hypothetical protein
MDPRLILILAAAIVAMAGFVCITPDSFGFLRLPQSFLQLGMERTVTGLALMLLGFLVALSEAGGGDKPRRGRSAQPFAFAGEDAAPVAGELRLEPEPTAPPREARLVSDPAPEAPAGRRRPDLYVDLEEETAAAVPKPDNPPPPRRA